MLFTREADFETALIEILQNKGWESKVLKNPTEADLLRNWANILFDNNRGIDRLNDAPLTDTEMQQVLEQIAVLRTPLKLNGFINGKTISIKRDNPADAIHFGKEVSLKVYDRQEIAAGQSRYQIVQQPKFNTPNPIVNNRRGDILLLINGMPVIHIELKRSGMPVSQAYNQIEKYRYEGLFTGIYSLIQIFVAMNPDDAVYFASPGPDGKFNPNYCFRWADFNNEPIKYWKDFASSLLSIPMAHQMIGFYTVADDSDGVLKVLRSYQYRAANAISDKVSKTDWTAKNNRGGFVWHTTGSGKTMTSFKSAQLIANSKDADKVIFLMDRIELGTQSLKEYRNFAEANEEVQATEDTQVLVSKLKSTSPSDVLIVTSIQKMSNISSDYAGLKAHDLEKMTSKRLVIIVDECHRSTFGDMLRTIKQTFPSAIFFGFTGTPIHEENQKKDNTTTTVFGNELHRYSIADGIRDKNVLGFDPYKVSTYRDRDLRRVVALDAANASTEEEAINNPNKSEIFYRYMNAALVKMAGHTAANGDYIKGIEDYIKSAQYRTPEHQNAVVNDILENWLRLSHNYKFHGIFATSSIPEAIAYYRLFKQAKPDFKVTALFDPHIDNNGNVVYKEDGLIEIIGDYNVRYGQDYTMVTHGKFKKDIAARLAHKEPHRYIDRTPDMQIDLLIVVDQMLTGFDSKYINTLYLDKVMKYEDIIQAFSRTNRLFGPDKPFGTIRYYRKPHTMERNIQDAIKLYSGDKPLGLFVEHLDENLRRMNAVYAEIKLIFERAGVASFEKLPDETADCAQFAKHFKAFNNILEAAKIQGFNWEKLKYTFTDETTKRKRVVTLDIDERTYLILALRYKELFPGGGGGGGTPPDAPYEIDIHLTEIDTGVIDADYMNLRFEKYLKTLEQDDLDKEQKQSTLDDLHRSFASLTQEEQKYANIFLHDVQNGDAKLEPGKSFRDYITEYQNKAKNDQIRRIAELFSLDETKLRNMMTVGLNAVNINEYGRFDDLKNTVDKQKAKAYFEELESKEIPPFRVNIKVHDLLAKFILSGGFEV